MIIGIAQGKELVASIPAEIPFEFNIVIQSKILLL